MSEPLLELRHVSKRFRRGDVAVDAVDGVSFSLEAGAILALVGESGAGKSTVGRTVLGLERPDAGSVMFHGAQLERAGERRLRPARRRMHLVLQDPYESLHPGMRVGTIVGEPLDIAGVDPRERAHRVSEALEEVGLGPAERFHRRHPHELSGGQRQRVAMARALIGCPELVVADEPTSMLDASLRAGILDLMLGMRDRLGTAFVFITHDLALARYVSDRIAVMRSGRIVEIGPTERVVAEPRERYTIELLAASERELPPEEDP